MSGPLCGEIPLWAVLVNIALAMFCIRCALTIGKLKEDVDNLKRRLG